MDCYLLPKLIKEKTQFSQKLHSTCFPLHFNKNEAQAQETTFLEGNIFHSDPTPNSVISHLLKHPDHRAGKGL